MSGFIIRMVVSRATTSIEFLIDRASRIYSVALPALFFAILCAAISNWTTAPGYNVGIESTPWTHVPLQIVTNLTFTAELWGYETVPIFNSPFWSLSFECFYYLLFAIMFFHWHKFLGKLIFFLFLVISGPAIVFLFPVWLLGVLLYDTYLWLNTRPNTWRLITMAVSGLFIAAVVLRHRIGYLLTVTDLNHRTEWLQSLFSQSFRNRFGNSRGELPWLARASFSYYPAGIFAAAGMLWALVTIDRFCPNISSQYAKKIRWVADSTFALYLLHLPMILLAASVTGGHLRYRYLVAVAIGIMCIFAARPLDTLKTAMRRWLLITALNRDLQSGVPQMPLNVEQK